MTDIELCGDWHALLCRRSVLVPIPATAPPSSLFHLLAIGGWEENQLQFIRHYMQGPVTPCKVLVAPASQRTPSGVTYPKEFNFDIKFWTEMFKPLAVCTSFPLYHLYFILSFCLVH